MALVLLALGLLGLRPSPANAQPIAASPLENANRAGSGFGWDQTWVLTLGYSRGVDQLVGLDGVQVDAGLALPLTQIPRANAFKLWLGGQRFWSAPGFGLVTASHLTSVLTSDPTGRKLGLGGELSLRPGYYAADWSVALEVAGRLALSTYIWHSERVRDLYAERYPDGSGAEDGPQDGWYWLPAARYHLGVAGGWLPSRSFELSGVIGFDYSPQVEGVIDNASIGGVPFYIRGEGAYRW
ncbi:MAG: hypothetical protein KC766_14935 [Myxococcales bacterium]|nr:hypothetical protein [Myxococcales bacterium]